MAQIINIATTGKFNPGQIVRTIGIKPYLEFLPGLLSRHLSGDWGDLSAEDKRRNNQALREGTRLFSSYNIGNGVKIWIITEADRSVTTALLPEEY
jgi:hypothetical protein